MYFYQVSACGLPLVSSRIECSMTETDCRGRTFPFWRLGVSLFDSRRSYVPQGLGLSWDTQTKGKKKGHIMSREFVIDNGNMEDRAVGKVIGDTL